MDLQVLYEDSHCVAVCKPAGILVQGDRTGDPTLVQAVEMYLRRRYGKRGRVFIGVVHRLDRPVSGVLLLARTSKAAARLAAQFRAGTVRKVYIALVETAPPQPEGVLVHHLRKDAASNRTHVVAAGEPDARLARLAYRVLETHPGGTLVEVRPETGRSHQIRVQLAAAGAIIVGDLRYGSHRRLGQRIALHAASLDFEHPTQREPITVTAPLPADWDALLYG